jgi:hypothetical protein
VEWLLSACKIPWVELSVPGKNTEIIADSTLITKALIERDMLQDLNARLSAKERAHDLAIRALLEEKLFFYNVRERWINNYYTMRDYSMAKVPFPRRAILGYLGYRANVRKLHDQGTGRFSEDEIRAFRREIWESINELLEESRKSVEPDECFWVLGSAKPTEADATVYGFVVSTLIADAGPESKQLVQAECPAAVEYATRIHRCYFPDYEMWD